MYGVRKVRIDAAGLSMAHSESWRTTYRGVGIEAYRRPRAFTRSEREWDWCHYITVNEQQFEPADLLLWTPELKDYSIPGASPGPRWMYDYYASPWSNLEWHGDITFFDILGPKEGTRALKAGCDYQHSFDEGRDYGLSFVVSEAKATVDSLWAAYPGLRVRCGCMGTYHPLSDVEPWGDGFISAAGAKARDDYKIGGGE